MTLQRRLPVALALALANAVGLACATAPGASQSYEIQSVVQRGPYLDARMARGGETLRFFFPAEDDACRQVLRHENHVEYVVQGPLGTLRDGDLRCEPAGIGSIDWWRRRRGRPEVPPVPRGTAQYQPVHADAEVLMVRGRFPLTGLVNWAGGFDTIAVLPRSPACERLLPRGEATIEYRSGGRMPLRLISDGESCVIEGLVRPLS